MVDAVESNHEVPLIKLEGGLNLGSLHDGMDSPIGSKPFFESKNTDNVSEKQNLAPSSNVDHTDVEISLPRLAAMLNVNRSQANNTYAKVRDMENRRINKYGNKVHRVTTAKKRPLSAVQRSSHGTKSVKGASEADDLSPRAVPVTMANRDSNHKHMYDPLSSNKAYKNRSPFNSPRPPEDDKLQALLNLTLKEYYDKHKTPPSLWNKDQEPDIPLIKQLFPINHPDMIRVAVTSSPNRLSPAPMEDMATGSILEKEILEPISDGPLPQLVHTMIFDEEDAQLRREMRQVMEKEGAANHNDFKLDDHTKKMAKPLAKRPHSAAGNFDQQRINFEPPNLQHQHHALEVNPAIREELQHPPASLARPVHSRGLPGTKVQARPNSAHNLRNHRPKTADRIQRRQKREMEELTKLFQFADLEIHGGVNVLPENNPVLEQIQMQQQQQIASQGPSPSSFNNNHNNEYFRLHQHEGNNQHLSPPDSHKRPKSQQTSGQRHRRLIDPQRNQVKSRTQSRQKNRSRSASPSSIPNYNNNKKGDCQSFDHKEDKSVDPRRGVQLMAYEIVSQHEKSLLKSGYDVPISILAPEIAKINSHDDANGNVPSPMRKPIFKDLLPISLQQEIQRQLHNYKVITGQIAPSLEKPVIPLLQMASDLAPQFDKVETNDNSDGDVISKKPLKLKWKRFVGHHNHPLLPRLALQNNNIQAPEDNSLEEESSYFVTNEAMNDNHFQLAVGAVDHDGSSATENDIALPSLQPTGIKPTVSMLHTKPQHQFMSVPVTAPHNFSNLDVAVLNAAGLAMHYDYPLVAQQDTVPVILNPNIRSPRLDTPYYPNQQDQLLEHLQWKHKHITANSLPGRKLQRPPSVHNSRKPNHMDKSTAYQPISPPHQHMPNHLLQLADPQQQLKLADAAAAAAVAVAQHLAGMQIPCTPQQVADIQLAILQGQDMTQALDRILFQNQPSNLKQIQSDSPIHPNETHFISIDHDGLPPLGATPASRTALGDQHLQKLNGNNRLLRFEEKLMTETGRDAVTLWQQQINQEQLRETAVSPLQTQRLSPPPSPPQHDDTDGAVTIFPNSTKLAVFAQLRNQSPPAATTDIPLRIPSVKALSGAQQTAPADSVVDSNTNNDVNLASYVGEIELQPPISARSQGQHASGVLQVNAAHLVDAFERPDIRLKEQSKRYGDYVNLRNIEQMQDKQQQKNPQNLHRIAHSLHSKLSPRNESPPLPLSPNSPNSPVAVGKVLEGWKVPEISPVPPPLMVFHKSSTNLLPQIHTATEPSNNNSNSHTLHHSTEHQSSRRPSSMRLQQANTPHSHRHHHHASDALPVVGTPGLNVLGNVIPDRRSG